MNNSYGEYDAPSESNLPALGNKNIRIIIFGAILFVTLLLIGGQAISAWLNLAEFDDLFVKPLYYSLLSGLILSPLAFIRFDFRNRRSLTWWSISMLLASFRKGTTDSPIEIEKIDFSRIKLSPQKFLAWQFTKLILGVILFGNVLFGLTISGMIGEWNLGLNSLWTLFSLPFITPGMDTAFAQTKVIPMIPSLTLFVPPLAGALSVRLVLLVGLTHIVRIATELYVDSISERPLRIPYLAIQSLIALIAFWIALSMFFPNYIDFNTRYVIAGIASIGFAMSLLIFYEKFKRKLDFGFRKNIIIRVAAVLVIILLTGSVVVAQNTIADAKKVEWRGPYTVQEIAVNQYLADIEDVKIEKYDFSKSLSPVQYSQLESYIDQNEDILDNVRLWDWEAAFAKLKPEIGLIPYVDFQDSDILRFNNTLYWSASMKPELPSTVTSQDTWYNTHLVYTHVPEGFLLLNGNAGTIADTENFFQQRKIYYGEGGLLQDNWAAYPADRTVSDEISGFSYNGDGGVDLAPPLSWIFESTFLLSYPDTTIHVMRYQDVYDRMELLFPYFLYEFNGKRVDMLPVTDGENTYWMMPLLVGLNGDNIPWSGGNPIIRLVGYALIDSFDGDVEILITGDDFFSELFAQEYSEYVISDVPTWLEKQIKFPEEYFRWKVDMFSFYHVDDARTFIEAKEFFEVPEGLDTYYVIEKPPGFEEPEYLGLISLELRGSAGRNLAGYMIARNDHPHLGELTFYEVPLDSSTKLLGPSAVLEALERNPTFATKRTLLRDPRVGDNILYRIGHHDVYFIPIYTAGAGGVVSELGGIAAVGAAFDGEYNVGITDSNSAKDAFREFLKKLGEFDSTSTSDDSTLTLTYEDKLSNTINLFTDNGFTILLPESIDLPLTFNDGNILYLEDKDLDTVQIEVDDFLNKLNDLNEIQDVTRIFLWETDNSVNFGAIVVVEGISELHYISVFYE